MIGGTVIENALDVQPETQRVVARLWCFSATEGECAVWADPHEASDVQPGDTIWWQSMEIMWSRGGEFSDRVIQKVGYSFDPRIAQEEGEK